jgi:hypothetical protein
MPQEKKGMHHLKRFLEAHLSRIKQLHKERKTIREIHAEIAFPGSLDYMNRTLIERWGVRLHGRRIDHETVEFGVKPDVGLTELEQE